MPKYCKDCGAKLKEEFKFCGNCGSKIDIVQNVETIDTENFDKSSEALTSEKEVEDKEQIGNENLDKNSEVVDTEEEVRDIAPTDNENFNKNSENTDTENIEKNIEPPIENESLATKKGFFTYKRLAVALTLLVMVIVVVIILWPRVGPLPYIPTTTVEPSADFSFITSGSSISFADKSTTGNGVSFYLWDFGDETTSTQKNPAHQYTRSGTYTVSLEITDGNGKTDSITKTVSVTIPNNPPSAKFSSKITGLSVVFTDESFDSDGTIKSWKWRFGDGQTSYQQAPSHSYSSDGTYMVTLKVTDDDGVEGTYSDTISVEKPNNIPTAQCSASPESGTVPLTVKFTGTGTDNDGYIISYNWEFGDGGTSTIQSPSHVYIYSGTYVAKLTVTDNRGATDSVSITINVEEIIDTDNDGIPDFEDIYDYGNGGIKITVTELYGEDGDIWPWQAPDMLVGAGLAVNYLENGTWTSLGTYESLIFKDQNTVYNALIWIVDVDDNIRQVFGSFIAADDDGALGHQDIDLNGTKDGRAPTDLQTQFVFNPRTNSIGYFSDDGRLDGNSDELDGYIKYKVEVVNIN